MNKNKLISLASVALFALALVIEILPLGAVLCFDGGEEAVRAFSYFDMTVYGYANFFPLITGIFTLSVFVLSVVLLFKKGLNLLKWRFWVASGTVIISVLPIIYGVKHMNLWSYTVTLLLLCGAVVGFICIKEDGKK